MTATPKQLEKRWETVDGKERLDKVIEAAKHGEDWAPILEGFPYVEELEAAYDLRFADLGGRDLNGVRLSGAVMNSARLVGADLRGAKIAGAILDGAALNGADLRGADLRLSLMRGTSFWLADLRGAVFDGAILQGSGEWGHVVFADAKFDRRTSFLDVDISKNDWSTNALLKRHVEDQQWLYAWRSKNRFNYHILYWVWLATCDCGRSFWLWAFWSALIAIGFGAVFTCCGDRFDIGAGKTLVDASWFMPFYYSIVTFTTLGFGDVVPRAEEGWMQFLVTCEVVLGYIMLGGLISIFANKLARRA